MAPSPVNLFCGGLFACNRRKITQVIQKCQPGLDYFGIRELENLFTNDDNDDDNYYKPVLVKSSFKNNYKYYESRGDKDKKLSVKQYLYMIMPYLSDLINDHKNIRNESNEWKIQLNMSVNFISSNDTGEICTFLCGVTMKKLDRVMKQMTLLKDFLNLS